MNFTLKNITIILLLFCAYSTMGQNGDASNSLKTYQEESINTKSFDKGHWERIVGGIDYSEIQKTKKKKKRKERTDTSKTATPDTTKPWFKMDGKIWGGIAQFLLIAFAVLLLAILGMHLFGNNLFTGPKNTRILTKDGKIDVDNIEENMHQIELKDPIQLAIQRGEYDTAIRLYYISIIKELSVKKMIKWKKDKTNRDYYNELAGQTIQSSFSDMTNVYERIWYGSKSLKQQDFNSLESRFQQVINSIKQIVIPTNG